MDVWGGSGRMVGQPEVIQKRASRKLAGLVTTSRLVVIQSQN
jgi:hypothetical protein